MFAGKTHAHTHVCVSHSDSGHPRCLCHRPPAKSNRQGRASVPGNISNYNPPKEIEQFQFFTIIIKFASFWSDFLENEPLEIHFRGKLDMEFYFAKEGIEKAELAYERVVVFIMCLSTLPDMMTIFVCHIDSNHHETYGD